MFLWITKSFTDNSHLNPIRYVWRFGSIASVPKSGQQWKHESDRDTIRRETNQEILQKLLCRPQVTNVLGKSATNPKHLANQLNVLDWQINIDISVVRPFSCLRSKHEKSDDKLSFQQIIFHLSNAIEFTMFP